MENFAHRLGVLADCFTTSTVDRGQISLKRLQRTVRNSDLPNERRMRALLNIGGRIIPHLEDTLSLLTTDPSRIIEDDCEVVSCIGYGQEQTVFLVEGPLGQEVTKVDRYSIGRNRKWLEEKRDELDGYRQAIAEKYAYDPVIVLPEEISVGKSHVPFMDAVLTRQPYVSSLQDFFRHFSGDELQKMASEDPVFASQIRFFRSTFVNQFQTTGYCVDILGRKNLSVTSSEIGHRLIFLEGHMLQDFAEWKRRGRFDRNWSRMSELLAFWDQLG